MGAVSSGMGDAGLFGPAGPSQQNYVPTEATRNNPNVSIGFGMPPPMQDPNTAYGDPTSIQGNQPAPNPLPTDGMGGGKSMGGIGNLVGGALGTGGQMLNQFGLPQVGNALGQVGGAAQQIFPNQQPTQQNYVPTQATRTNPNVSIGFGMPAPVNRFAPPNAPGVRMAPQQAQFGAAGQLGSARANLAQGRAPLSNAVARSAKPNTRTRLR